MTPFRPKQVGDGLRRFASMQAFRDLRVSTRGLIAGPWTPLASLCSRRRPLKLAPP